MDWLLGMFPLVLIVLICPLMMIFMMRGMHSGHDAASGHGDHHRASDEDPERSLAQLEEEIGELKLRLAAGAPARSASETHHSTVRHV